MIKFLNKKASFCFVISVFFLSSCSFPNKKNVKTTNALNHATNALNSATNALSNATNALNSAAQAVSSSKNINVEKPDIETTELGTKTKKMATTPSALNAAVNLDVVFIPLLSEVPQAIALREIKGNLVFAHMFLKKGSKPAIFAGVSWSDIYKTNKINPASKDLACIPVLPFALSSKDCLKLALTKHLKNFRGLSSIDPSLPNGQTVVLEHKESFISEANLPKIVLTIQAAIEELKRP